MRLLEKPRSPLGKGDLSIDLVLDPLQLHPPSSHTSSAPISIPNPNPKNPKLRSPSPSSPSSRFALNGRKATFLDPGSHWRFSETRVVLIDALSVSHWVQRCSGLRGVFSLAQSPCFGFVSLLWTALSVHRVGAWT